MKTKEIARIFLGSCAVYVVVAACSSTSGSRLVGDSGGSDAQGDGGTKGTEVATAGAANDGGAEGNAATTNAGGASSIDTGTSIAATGGSGITDPVPTANADPVNGTRLKAKYRLGADGSKEYLSGQWWDSERNEDCSFAKVNETTLACLPAIRNGVIYTYYSDSECSVILELVSVTVERCPTAIGTYVWDVGSVTCNSNVKIFSLGSQFSGVAYSMMSTNGAPGVCTVVTPTGSSTSAYYTLGAEIPISSFVAATNKIDS